MRNFKNFEILSNKYVNCIETQSYMDFKYKERKKINLYGLIYL